MVALRIILRYINSKRDIFRQIILIYLNRSQYFYEGQSTYFDELPEYLSLSLFRVHVGYACNLGCLETLKI